MDILRITNFGWFGFPDVFLHLDLFYWIILLKRAHTVRKYRKSTSTIFEDCFIVTGKKMMTLLWYYRPEHTEQGRQAWHTDSDVYASRHLDNNSVDCIDDKAFVLPVELYSRFMAYQKRQVTHYTGPWPAADLVFYTIHWVTLCDDL